MDSSLQTLAGIIRSELLHLEGVFRFAPNRRFTTLYSEGGPADSVLFLDSGMVKVFKRSEDGKEIILQIVSSGELFGEQALGFEHVRSAGAEVLQDGTIYVIPRDVFARFCDSRPELWRQVSQLLILRKRDLEKKIELLCLQDVEYRILHYLADLASAVGGASDGEDHAIPLSQGELASLIGATRETTSTMLNVLARRGLIKLGRRQLMVPSIDDLRGAAHVRTMKAAARVS